MKADQVNILGAGLVGTLLSIFLSKRGFSVNVFEKRGDPRVMDLTQGRSINLALSHRGIKALKKAGVYDAVEEKLIPMRGRMMHDQQGNLSFQPYGKTGQYINSVSRLGLTEKLITESEKYGSTFHFDHRCEAVDLDEAVATFSHQGKQIRRKAEALIGADGAYSILRRTMQTTDRFNFQQYYIEHGYKEFRLAPLDGDFALEPNYLHIWPRGRFMLIALPNPDKSFTCTLFFPYEGELSFDGLQDDAAIVSFFEQYFPDVIPIMPDFLSQFQTNPTSSLVTIKSYPWFRGNCMLIGDASHAIVPFYGQGMNAGFEDCRLFMEWGEELNFDWKQLFRHFSSCRKADTDAIADLALKNFVEMRDSVASERFLNVKKLEARLHDAFPDIWMPLYTMVTFSDMSYSRAQELGKIQEQIMNNLPQNFDPQSIELAPIIQQFNAAVKGAR